MAFQLLVCAALLQVASAGEAFVSPALRLARPAQVKSPTSVRASGTQSGWSAASESYGACACFAAAILVGSSFAGTAKQETSTSMAAHRKPTKKGRRIAVLECVEQRQMVKDGVPGAGGPRGGVSRYYTEKNVRNTPELLKLRKYNKYLGRHTLHVELK
mmetsp:Transcript_31307/g.58791  ORF Transcript_31307/g.58791 Transcript_31307/m.58791 type:complete len:159 (-) Transcript_31307:40-516(-)